MVDASETNLLVFDNCIAIASDIEGLWFCGLPWLRIQSSGLLDGSTVEAKTVVEQIASANAVWPWPAESPV